MKEPVELIADGLSAREKQVLELMLQGYDNGRLEQTLQLCSQTVRNYVSKIYDKLNSDEREKLNLRLRARLQ